MSLGMQKRSLLQLLILLVGLGSVALMFGGCGGSSPPVEVPPSPQPQNLVLRYRDFGAPIDSHELLGEEWWQWQPHGDSRPRTYDVRVVVYCNQPLEEVALQYPVVPENEQDYRYVEYDVAMQYLRDTIAFILESPRPGYDTERATRVLRATLGLLPKELPECGSTTVHSGP